MRPWVIGLLVVGAIYVLKPGKIELTPEDLASVPTPLEEQKRLILVYLRELECKGHSPCFYAIVDGALARDPQAAVSKCRSCETNVTVLQPPAGLPAKVTRLLEMATEQTRTNVRRFKEQAEDHIAIRAGRRVPRREKGPNTCDVYAVISQITKAYGLDKKMRGKYVDCEYLATIK